MNPKNEEGCASQGERGERGGASQVAYLAVGNPNSQMDLTLQSIQRAPDGLALRPANLLLNRLSLWPNLSEIRGWR